MKREANDTAHESLPLDGEDSDKGLLRCDDIQMLLFAYMTRELGDVQSRVVREHLRICDACRLEAAAIEQTLETLRAGAGAAGEDMRLSDERRERLWRAVFHPVLDWMDRHHRLVAGIIALFTLLLTLYLLRHAAIWKRENLGERIPIWRMMRNGRIPELVQEAGEEATGAGN